MAEVRRLDLALQAQPTDAIVTLDGVPCRLWQGVDEAGGQYLLYVHRAMPLDAAAAERLAAVLAEVAAPERSVVRADVAPGVN